VIRGSEMPLSKPSPAHTEKSIMTSLYRAAIVQFLSSPLIFE